MTATLEARVEALEAQVERLTRQQRRPATNTRDFSTQQRCVIRAVTDVAGVDWADLTDHKRGPQRIADARAVLITMLILKCGMTVPQVAKFIGRTSQAVRQADKRVSAFTDPTLSGMYNAVSEHYWEILP